MLEIGSHLIDRNSPLISIIWHKECDISQKVKRSMSWLAFGLKLLAAVAAPQQPWTWWTSQCTPLGLNDEWLAVRKIIFVEEKKGSSRRSSVAETLQIFLNSKEKSEAWRSGIQQYGTATPFRKIAIRLYDNVNGAIHRPKWIGEFKRALDWKVPPLFKAPLLLG